ncbi:uncharacterized protein ACRADG_008544 [Cochliomyia hominivorax]
MNALTIFVIGGNIGNIYSQREAICKKCVRNTNGMCMFYEAPCRSENIEFFYYNTKWTNTDLMNCYKREMNEVKVCFMDCENIYNKERCPSILYPVCGYSEKLKKCKKFANPCLFKQDACRDPNIMDWRVAHLTACQLLRVGGPAGDCVEI